MTTLILAYKPEEITTWYIALGIGLVVILVAATLLTLLVRLVQDIDTGVFGVWEMAKRVAANTATTWMLVQTAAIVDDIKQEALIHDDFLSRVR
ncbi:MAG: hypothetical protein ACRDIU_08735 [Actinomycetota bacterium]